MWTGTRSLILSLPGLGPLCDLPNGASSQWECQAGISEQISVVWYSQSVIWDSCNQANYWKCDISNYQTWACQAHATRICSDILGSVGSSVVWQFHPVTWHQYIWKFSSMLSATHSRGASWAIYIYIYIYVYSNVHGSTPSLWLHRTAASSSHTKSCRLGRHGGGRALCAFKIYIYIYLFIFVRERERERKREREMGL